MSIETNVRQALTDIATAAATADELARLLWTWLHCDPDDPETSVLWAALPEAVRRQYAVLANVAREHLERVEAWSRPRRWDSVHEVPPGVTFAPIEDVRRFVVVDDHARALPPAAPIRYAFGAMDSAFPLGYREVR